MRLLFFQRMEDLASLDLRQPHHGSRLFHVCKDWGPELLMRRGYWFCLVWSTLLPDHSPVTLRGLFTCAEI
jgi:hypothetical protein